MEATSSALNSLWQMISSGCVAPGEKLPTQAELCAQFGVSAGSLREAIKMLSALGILVPRHGSGVYVSDLSVDKLIGSLSFTLSLLPLDGVLDLYEVRRLLEGQAAALAAANSTHKMEGDLLLFCEQMEKTEDSVSWSEIDAAFHDYIAGMSRNSALRALLKVLRIRNRAYHGLFSTDYGRTLRTKSETGHRQIADAIIAGDSLGASNAAVHHILQTEQWLRECRPAAAPIDASGNVLEQNYCEEQGGKSQDSESSGHLPGRGQYHEGTSAKRIPLDGTL